MARSTIVPSDITYQGWFDTRFRAIGSARDGALLVSDGFRVDVGRVLAGHLVGMGMLQEVTHWMPLPKIWIRCSLALPPEWEYVLVPDHELGAVVALWSFAVRLPRNEERPCWTSRETPRVVRRWSPLPVPPQRSPTGQFHVPVSIFNPPAEISIDADAAVI